jgi:adenylate kinase
MTHSSIKTPIALAPVTPVNVIKNIEKPQIFKTTVASKNLGEVRSV